MWSSRKESIAEGSAGRWSHRLSNLGERHGRKVRLHPLLTFRRIYGATPRLRRVIADPVHEGQADGNAPYQALVIRPEFATEMLGQRQIVSIIGCRQVESVGEHKRLKVQPRGL